MNRVHYTVTHLKNKAVVYEKEGYLEEDKFEKLMAKNGRAKLTTTYQHSVNFGTDKVVVTLSCACDQDEETINEAGKLTFLKAVELVTDNFSLLEDNSKQM